MSCRSESEISFSLRNDSPKNGDPAARRVRPTSVIRSMSSSSDRTWPAIAPSITDSVPLLTAGILYCLSFRSIARPVALARTSTHMSLGSILRSVPSIVSFPTVRSSCTTCAVGLSSRFWLMILPTSTKSTAFPGPKRVTLFLSLAVTSMYGIWSPKNIPARAAFN